MLKLIGSKWNNLHINNTLRILQVSSSSSSSSSSSTPNDSLFLRICRAGDPTVPMTSILHQWVEEGRDITQPDLQFSVKQLRAHRRFNHALQTSEWMSNERNLHLSSGDIAVRLDLIAKVHGLDQAEKYFNSISESSRDFKVYGALLHCYAQHNSVEKAEAIMHKIKDHASKHGIDLAVSYNSLLKLYARTGQREKLVALMQEMRERVMFCSGASLNTWLNAYVTTNDTRGMEELLAKMEVDSSATLNWFTYATAADGYTKAGQFDKSLAMLKKSEQLIKGKARRAGYESLLTKYAAVGKKDEVYRIWDMCKNLNGSRNSSYISMLTALSKLDDIDGAERILEEWESGNTCFDIRIPNVMVSAYSKNGLMDKAEAYVGRLLKRDNGVVDGSTWDRLARGYYKCNDMDKAVQTMKKAVLVGRERGWRPYPFTFAACIEHMKDKEDLELALEILGICRERSHFSAATCDRLLSYVHGEITETNVLNLLKGDYHLKTDEVPHGEKQHEMCFQGEGQLLN